MQSSAQTVAPSFASLAPTAFDASGPVLRAPAQPEKPFTVAGERGVLLGQQDGTFEAWVLPVKLLSHLTIEATIEGYTVPIHVNQQAASIEVRPDRTILTYSHIGFTLRQIMFSPDKAPGGTGPIALFEFDCLHSTDFTFRFIPNLEWMWPERNEGVPGIEWVPSDPHAASSPGFYVLHSDYPDLAGALTIPGAQPGILAPYQERPQDHPVELKLHIDPARDNGRLFPLLMAAGMNSNSATNAALGATLAQLNASIPSLYATHSASYRKFLENAVTIDTPDKSLNQAFQWAEISIEQLKAHPVDAHDTPTDETALVAGYYASGDSARPGFGWFFGRDSLYTLYAINGYGDFALTRSELEFLIHRQRADGKIMHEYSQTAAAIDWQAFPYEYAAADSTPLFLLAFADYLRASGDTAFIAAHRDAIEKAWAFETDPAHDTDHDGIYDNSQGTGWVESWPGGMPHQEIYLALLDQQASSAMAYIETALKDSSKADIAAQRATAIAKTINAEYYDPRKGCYAFATNPSGSPNSPVDRTTTVYPALAWWDPQSNKSLLDHGDECLRQLASADLNTDWGLRDVSNKEKIYDGTSYHQGSVWPLFTGWAALAEYRGNQPLTGYQMLKENANLTWAQDLGADTELLSGDFFVPFGRSTSHQLWSSAMVITPTLRGLFGISIDAATRTITVNPHLPAGWDHAEIRNLHIGNETVDLKFVQTKTGTLVWQNSSSQAGIHLRSDDTRATVRPDQELSFSRHPVEIAPVLEEPLPGNRTQAARVVAEEYGEHNLTVTIEGIAGSEVQLPVILSSSEVKLHIAGGELAVAPNDPAIVVHFPSGAGFQTLTVTLTW
ncbi:MAG TPA: hypothetical protein VK716_10475 [Terracidiphilus sp.]|nr:hypothetical protein [Terracidiphilus sp.]